MNATISRRGFIRSAASMAVASAFLTQEAKAASPYYRPITYSTDQGLNADQSAIVGRAMNFVATRMLDPRMLAAARYNYRYYMVEAPGRTFRTKADFEGWFHHIQMQSLRVMGFPRLSIYGRYDAAAQWVGRGSLSTVTAEYASDRGAAARYFTKGGFTVTLNTAHLGNSRLSYGRSADYWAGVVCHEMLHNLGHHHPENVYDGIFMRAYENAVARNG